jgi:plastocyanin
LIRAFAAAYTIGVVLAAPVTLHAADDTAVKIETAPQAAPEPEQAQMKPEQQPAPGPKPEPEPQKPKPIAVKAAPGSVQMRDFNFSPATITVNVGEAVTWVNAGEEPHNAVGDDFSTALLDPGKSGSKSFSSAGSFSYICTVHPQMKGTVKVVGAQTQSPSGSEDSGTEDDAAAAAEEPQGPQLAKSGLDAWLLGLAGVALLAAGMAVRRRIA